MARAVTSVGDRIAALASAGTLYLPSNQKVILTPSGLRFDLLDLADRHAEDADLVAGEHAVAVGEVGDHLGAVAVVDGSQRHQRTGEQVSARTAAMTVRDLRSVVIAILRPGRRRAVRPAPARRPAPASARAPRRSRRRRGGRARRRAARRRRGQRLPVRVAARGAGQRQTGRTAALIAGVAGDRVGQRQVRLAALAGPRVGHRQRRGAGLADLRVGALRRQQRRRVEAEVGERRVDERLR